ncbi:MAG: ABC transporter ATP-binding protein [Pseudomonadota bacterium]
MSFGQFAAVRDLTLGIGAGEVCCLLGPSGCGKTTTLRIAAGVERQESGRVFVKGREVSGNTFHQPPEERSIGLMFQDFALFPHLNVAGNIGFGLRSLSRKARGEIVEGYLDKVGLAGYGPKYPHQLSGGEQQRVALARALAPKPRVMLMDEPFSGLDNRLRDDVRDQTLALLKEEGTAVLMVTHEPSEAMRMADRIALMRGGEIVQLGAPYDLYNHPVDQRAAAFFSDVNVVHGVVTGSVAETPFGAFPLPEAGHGGEVEIIVRPQHLRIGEDTGAAPEAVAEDSGAVRGTVVRARFVGLESLIECRMDHDGSILKATVPYAWLPEPGTAVWLSLRRDRCFVFPSSSTGRSPELSAAE